MRKWPDDYINKVLNEDCLNVLKELPDRCIDLVLTDPPYGITNNDWDSTEKLPEVFNECLRVLKDWGGLVFTASEPFNHEMYQLLKKYFRHSWVWDKDFPGSFQNAKFRPLKVEESIMVFSNNTPVNYYPIMRKIKERKSGGGGKITDNYSGLKYYETIRSEAFPKSIIRFFNGDQKNKQHPTQKPVSLMSYLIQTYSQPNDIIFDPFLGSGTTAVAAKQLGRNYIGIEISEKYCKIANDRLRQEILL